MLSIFSWLVVVPVQRVVYCPAVQHAETQQQLVLCMH